MLERAHTKRGCHERSLLGTLFGAFDVHGMEWNEDVSHTWNILLYSWK